MSDANTVNERDLAPEYDFSKGVRGKYSSAYKDSTNLVAIDPDLLKIFPDSEAVNRALRSLVNKQATQTD